MKKFIAKLANKKEAKKFFMNPKEGRHQWMALCLIMVKERLKRKDYGFKDIG